MTTSRKLSVILAADAVGYSRLSEKNEKAALAAVTWFRERAAEVVKAHGGRLFFRAGDGVMAELPTASAGVRAALELADIVRHRVARDDAAALPVRIGLHLGEAAAEADGDLLGHDVNVAARIEQIADAGEVLASRVLADAAKGKVAASFERLGRERLKNLSEPVEVFRVAAAASGKPKLALLGAAAAAVVLVAVGVGYFGGRLGQPQEAQQTRPTEAAPAVDALSIAVLPFVNMSSDPEQEYFSDGLSEELLNQLAQIDGLQVIGRTSSFAFKGRNEDLRVIGEQLGAAHLLEGSVRKSGDRLRITAQLIDSGSGAHLWSQTYDRELTDVFAIQDEIAMAVADALSITLGVGDVLSIGGTRDVVAWDLYLKGIAALRGQTDSSVDPMEVLRQAVERDPAFAAAWLALADANLYLSAWAPERAAVAMRDAGAAYARAAEALPEGYYRRSAEAFRKWVIDDDLAAAGLAFEEARALAPEGRPQILGPLGEINPYGTYLEFVGRFREAEEAFLEVVAGDPLNPSASFQLQYILDVLERPREAEAESMRITGRDAQSVVAEFQRLERIWIAGAPEAEIRAQYERFVPLDGGFIPLNAALGPVLDDPPAARALIAAAMQDPAYQDFTRLGALAQWAAMFGDADLALEGLRRAHVGSGSTLLEQIWHPVFAPFRSDPRFAAIVRDIGIYDAWRATGKWGDFCRPLGADDFECE